MCITTNIFGSREDIPEDMRCKRCDGWKTVSKTEFKKNTWSWSLIRCPECNGTGWCSPKIPKNYIDRDEILKDLEEGEPQMGDLYEELYSQSITSIYPQTEPKHEGFYLVMDDVSEKWRIAEWCKRFASGDNSGGWQPCNDVRMFIPFRLIGPKG